MLAPALAEIAARGERVDLSVQRALVPVARMVLPTAGLGPPMDGAAMGSLFGPALEAALAERLRTADRIHAWLRRGDRDGALSRRLGAFGVPFALHEVPRADAPHHASIDYATALGVAPLVAVPRATAPPPSLPLPWRRQAARRLVLHPGAGASGKMWTLEGFRRLSDAWEAAGGEVVVLLGPAESAHADAWRAVGRAPLVHLAITDAAALIASATFWVGNDSGMSHLAGALARAGVVVFTTTRAARWRPLGGRLAAVEVGGRTLDAVVTEIRGRLGWLAAPPYLDTPRPRH